MSGKFGLLVVVGLVLGLAGLAGCGETPPGTDGAGIPPKKVVVEPAQNSAEPSKSEKLVELKSLCEGVWRHISFKDFGQGPYASNGLVVETEAGFVLIDTAYTDDQTRELLKQLPGLASKPVALALITHAHDDRIGGIRAFFEAKIPVKSLQITVTKAQATGYPLPEALPGTEGTLTVGKTEFQFFFPGPGHSPDNLVVYIPGRKLLFGGCLLRALEAKNFGNYEDADVPEWPKSVTRVREHFPEPEIVVPGHGEPGDSRLISHTLNLLRVD